METGEIEVAELNSFTGKMPTTGNVSEAPPSSISDAEKQKLATDKLAKEQADKEAKAAEAALEEQKTRNDGLTDTEIQAKLDELAKKDEKDLSDDDKKIIEKFASKETDKDEITIVKDELEATYGIKLQEKYENNIQGFKAVANDIAPELAKQMFYNALSTVPHMKEFYEHMTGNKSIETFLVGNTKPVFEGIELKDTAGIEDEKVRERLVLNQKSLIEMDFKSKGLTDEDIRAFIDLTEAKGELYSRAKLSKESLTKIHKDNVEQAQKAENDRIVKEQEENNKLVKDLELIIEKNDFDGASIPTTDLKLFKEAMFKPVDKEGRTLLDYKRAKLTLSQRALIDYIVFKDLKIVGLAAKQQSKSFTFKKANEDNDKRKGGGLGGDGTRDANGSIPTFALKDIDFKTLMKQ